MGKSLLHTPEGVRDIYGSECKAKQFVTDKILRRMQLSGYELIETPGFEYFDIFRKERGTVDPKLMYRFFDRDGETLVIRPDVTPSIARCAAKYYKNETMPLRFCYKSNTYINSGVYQGKLKETTQMGIELINDNSVYSDAEVLVCAISSLLDSGLSEFQLEVGNAAFFDELIKDLDLDADTLTKLRGFIEEKFGYGVEALLEKYDNIPEETKTILSKLSDSFGSIKQLKESEAIKLSLKNRKVKKAFDRLVALDKVLAGYGLDGYVTYDLSMLGKLGYYTGIIFRGYTYGTGEQILSGGRYDNLVSQFGLDAPAVGMSITVDYLMAALSRQKKEISPREEKILIIASEKNVKEAYKKTSEYRFKGINTTLQVTNKPVSTEELENYMDKFSFTKAEVMYE